MPINNGLTFKTILVVLCVIMTLFKAHSRELVMYTSDAPPHMIAATNSGIDIEIVKTILAEMGHKVSVEFTPLKRAMEQVKKKEADVFLPTFFQQDSKHIFISEAFIQYRPMIFSIKQRTFNIKQFSDLRDLRIVSFQGATGYFGEEFKAVTEQANYTELHDMSKLPKLLLMNRYDIVVLDYYIFYYFLKMYQEQSALAGNEPFPLIDNYSSLIKRHDLIPQVNAYVGFNDKILRNQFNLQLQKFIKNNRHNQIIEKYIGTISSRIFAFNNPAKNLS